MLDESCSSSSLRPTLTLVARSSSYFLSLAPLLPVARGLSQGTWNMTRARMRQHEYYFIVQRRLARHYCWLELLSRPTSVMAHDTRSLYASLLPVCVSPLPAAEPLLGVGRASPHVPRLSFTAFVWPVFCASLEAAQASPVTIAARTRHATADTSTGERLVVRVYGPRCLKYEGF